MTDGSPDAVLRTYRLPGEIDLLVYPTRKFKTSLVNILVHRPLDSASSAAALLPYLLRRGTRRHPDMVSLSRHLEALFGASLDVELLRYGERQILSFRLDVVDDRYLIMGGKGLLRKGMRLLREILLDPALDGEGEFDADVFEQERLNLLRFLRSIEEDKSRYAIDRCVRHMFAGEPYARFAYGEPEEVEALRREEVGELWRELLRTAPIEIYVIGGPGARAVRDVAADFFGDLRDGGTVRTPAGTVWKRAGRVRRLREEAELTQSRLVMGYRTGGDGASLAVWNTLFGGGSFSRLFQHVRERSSLAYYCSSFVDHPKRAAFVHAGMDGSKAERVERIVKRQMTELRRGRIELDELKAAKAYLRGCLQSLRDSPGRIAAYFQERRATGESLSIEASLRQIARVRREDVRRAAEDIALDTVYLLAEATA